MIAELARETRRCGPGSTSDNTAAKVWKSTEVYHMVNDSGFTDWVHRSRQGKQQNNPESGFWLSEVVLHFAIGHALERRTVRTERVWVIPCRRCKGFHCAKKGYVYDKNALANFFELQANVLEMLRRPLTSIEIKADDIDHMEKVLLELYNKKGATKGTVESDQSNTASEVFVCEARQTESPGSVTSSMDTSGNQTLPTLVPSASGFSPGFVIKVRMCPMLRQCRNALGAKQSRANLSFKKGRKDYHKDAKLKSWRMIIRNLPFKTTREEIQNVCSRFGLFTDVILPPSKKMAGRIAGFAFVQFKTRESAEKAREYFNANKFKGRLVAADWALPKDAYECAAQEERENLKKAVKLEKNERDGARNLESVSAEELNEEFSDSEDESSSKKYEMHTRNWEENTEEGDESENDFGEDDIERKDPAIDEERVVFLRNLSFETTDEKLKIEMAKFGDVKLAVCCKFRDSGHPKGTAFVHFSTAEEAKACLRAMCDGFVIDGREVKGLLAIQRENAEKIQKQKTVKVPEDKRNLRLLRFSLIREGTSAAKGMSAEDATKRQRLAELSRKKLQNLHMYVSLLVFPGI
uniref:RNA-binding protein 28 n=1 Tax=Angiostrongylus cantonensis TaxID=6313 RepID=A0A0K0DI05_ANGCA